MFHLLCRSIKLSRISIRIISLVSLVLASLLTAGMPHQALAAADPTTTGTLSLVATFHCISVYANFTGDDDADNGATLEYRVSGGSWKTGMDLVVDQRAQIATSSALQDNPFKYQWRGSIVGLDENTPYDVRVTFTDPDGVSGTNPVTGGISTGSSIISLGTGNVRYVSKTGSNSNDGTAPDSSHAWSTIAYGLANIGAGGTLYVLAGTYNESNLAIPSGTSWSNLTTLSNYGSDTVIVDSQDAEVCNFAMTGRNYWQLKGITMQYALQSNIYLASCLHFVIDGCTLKLCGHTGGTQHPTLYLVSGDGDGIIRNNQFLGGRGGFSGEQDNEAIACRLSEGHFIIHGNTVDNTDNWDAIGGANGASIKGGWYRDSDLYDNTIAHVRDDGFELEGGGVNNRCWGNIITDIGSPGYGSAISTVALLIGPTYVFKNIINSPQQCGVKTGGFGYTPEATSSGHLFVYNNTFYRTMEYGVGPYGNTHHTWNQHYKNNIFHTFSNAAWSNRNLPEDLPYPDGDEFDYNNLYRGSSGRIAIWGETTYNDLATLRSGTGQEIHGISANSLFVNAAGGDFSLQSGSPCINAGVIIAGFNDATSPYAYRGSAPDIGALESALGPAPTLTPTPTPTPAPTPAPTHTPTPTPMPTKMLTVATNPPTNVTTNAATLNAYLVGLGTVSSVIMSFEVGLTSSYGREVGRRTVTAVGFCTLNITGLTPGTAYHYRVKAVAGSTTVYGADMTFTTQTSGAPPQVRTDAATIMKRTSATLNGYLVSLGTASSVTVSFDVGLTTSYSHEVSRRTVTASGPFTFKVSGLIPGTTYHFRAKAVGSGATVYGVDVTFTTNP